MNSMFRAAQVSGVGAAMGSTASAPADDWVAQLKRLKATCSAFFISRTTTVKRICEFGMHKRTDLVERYTMRYTTKIFLYSSIDTAECELCEVAPSRR